MHSTEEDRQATPEGMHAKVGDRVEWRPNRSYKGVVTRVFSPDYPNMFSGIYIPMYVTVHWVRGEQEHILDYALDMGRFYQDSVIFISRGVGKLEMEDLLDAL